MFVATVKEEREKERKEREMAEDEGGWADGTVPLTFVIPHSYDGFFFLQFPLFSFFFPNN